MKTPYFAFYPQDWLSDPKVAQLTYEERGVYFDLLCRMWTFNDGSCSLPDNDQFICRILGVMPAKWRKLKAILIDGPAPVIDRQKGRLVNKRLSAEFSIAAEKSKKNSASAKERWKNKSDNSLNEKETGNANALRTECHTETDTEKDINTTAQQGARNDSEPDQNQSTLPPISEKPESHVEWINYFTRKGYDQRRITTPKFIRIFRDWCARGVTIELVQDACLSAERYNGGLPNTIDLYITFVESMERENAKPRASPPARSTTGGQRPTQKEKFDPFAYVNRNRIKPNEPHAGNTVDGEYRSVESGE